MVDWNEIYIYKYLKDKGSDFISNIDAMISRCENILKGVKTVFDNYTNHDIEHSKMVINYMSDLIDDIEQMSDLELTVIIYSGLLHDIGMVVTNEEIELIKNNKFELTDYKYECVFENIKDEKLSIQEIVRPIHGQKSKKYIMDNVENDEVFRNMFCIPNTTNIMFHDEVARICLAHNADFEWLKLNINTEVTKGCYSLNSQFIAILLRIGDLLDIDEQRTPLYLYKLIAPKGISDLEWKQHFVIENTKKIIKDPSLDIKKIILCGESSEAVIHRKVLKYIDYINFELRNALSTTSTFKPQYNLKLKSTVDNKIVTRNFSFSDFKLNLDYVTVTNLLMGENIYGNKIYGLRELIQNGIDACKLMEEESRGLEQYKWIGYKPFIRIEIDKNRNKVIIADNGIGMSLEIVKRFFLNVGISYYASNEFKFRGYEFNPIGNYGIGFLACFMLSDNVEIHTKRYDEHISNEISIEKNSEFICIAQKESSWSHGTDIILDYDKFSQVFKDINEIRNFIEKNFLDDDISIILSERDKEKLSEFNCDLVKMKKQENNIIRLDEYLKDIKSYVDIKYKNMKFIKKLSEILDDKSWNDCYVYNNNEIKEESDNLCISDFISENCIYYLSIPIINEDIYDDFIKAYDVLESYEEALDKVEPYYTINIFLKKEDIPKFLWEDCAFEDVKDDKRKFPERYVNDNYTLNFDELEIISDDGDIFDGISKKYFEENFNHEEDVPLAIKLNKQLIIGNNSDEFLCLHRKYEFNRYSYRTEKRICTAFNKNILLKNFNVSIPYWIEGINAKELLLNINSKKIIPNIARDNINHEERKKICYEIGKAIYLWIYNNADLGANKKELLNSFIHTFYK